VLAPFFAARLGKRDMAARQCSPRGGDVHVRLEGGGGEGEGAGAGGARRVFVSGEGVTTIRGTLLLPRDAL
jgi:hypothetical protein